MLMLQNCSGKIQIVLNYGKDFSTEKTGPVPVSEDLVDFRRIFANADVAGMKHFFVEHDMPKDRFASITTSYNNLQR